MVRECAWQGVFVAGGMYGKGHAWQRGEGVQGRGMHGRWGMCVRGMHDRGHAWQEVYMCGRRDGHCSRRYASYWNAFLFLKKIRFLLSVKMNQMVDHYWCLCMFMPNPYLWIVSSAVTQLVTVKAMELNGNTTKTTYWYTLKYAFTSSKYSISAEVTIVNHTWSNRTCPRWPRTGRGKTSLMISLWCGWSRETGSYRSTPLRRSSIQSRPLPWSRICHITLGRRGS